jgi:hypothetical protein
LVIVWQCDHEIRRAIETTRKTVLICGLTKQLNGSLFALSIAFSGYTPTVATATPQLIEKLLCQFA